MESIFLFMLKSITVSGFLMTYYWFILCNKKLHTFNRFYLLSSVAVRLIIPLLNFSLIDLSEPGNAIRNVLPANTNTSAVSVKILSVIFFYQLHSTIYFHQQYLSIVHYQVNASEHTYEGMHRC